MGPAWYYGVEILIDFEYWFAHGVYKVGSACSIHVIIFIQSRNQAYANHACKVTSQVTVERTLNNFLQEFQDGKHEVSLVASQTVESLSNDERQTWRSIGKD